MMDAASSGELLARLKARGIEVDLTTASRAPLTPMTVFGRCVSALREAGVPVEERDAFAQHAVGHVRSAAGAAPDYQAAVAALMSRSEDPALLRAAGECLVLRMNWRWPTAGDA